MINFIGMLITGLTIDKWVGHHPLIAFNGNKSQIGKSTLAKFIGIILGGEIPSTISYNYNQQEFEKSLATEVDKNTPIVIIDNVKGANTSSVINSPVLERCITDHWLNFRRLGSNTNISRQNDVIFITTMNDSKFSKDLQNRDIPINLEIQGPPRKLEYSISNINLWLLEHRFEVIAEVLGIIQKWKGGGCKVDSSAKHTLSNEWAQTIDSILRANGYYGFLDNYEESNISFDANYELIVELCENYCDVDFKSPADWAQLLGEKELKDKLTDKNGNFKSPSSQAIIVGKLFKDYLGETICCESGDYTIEKKQAQTRPKKNHYRFRKLSNGI